MRGMASLSLVILLLALTPAMAADPVLPDQTKTPGAIDKSVHGTEICAANWARGNPPTQGGSLSYGRAARETSEALKEEVFRNYGLEDPRDRGHRYEVDHRVPLSLGGRDEISNLWPESRTAVGFNAWIKDRREYRLYTLVCHPMPGDPIITLRAAQDAFLGDWTKAYATYCKNEKECPAYREK
jgi:hypothetical protein